MWLTLLSLPLLTLVSSQAKFSANVLGWGDKEVCGAATFAYCSSSLPDTYCSEGIPDGGNVVLNMVYKPYMWGGAYGGPCEFYKGGRPASIAFWNHVSIRDSLAALRSYDKSFRDNYLVALSTHEINHGLGFTISQFSQANIVELKDVYSEPNNKGVKEDSLWHFKTSTRVSRLAAVHFDCKSDDASWHGLPLMGKIEGGRDSHMNSFLVIEDLQSYGTGKLYTPFTMAALEDTGHYLANYSLAEFPNWGAYRCVLQ